MFYQEHKDSAVTLEMVSLGCCGILAGIAIMVHGKHGTLKPPETEAERKLHDASAGMRSGNTFRIRQGLRGAWRHAIFIQKLMDGVITQEEYRMLVNSNRRFTAAAQEDEAREEEQVMAEEFAAEDLEAALENLEAGVEEGANGRTRARTHSRERSISVAMAMEALEAMRPPTAKERWEKVRMQVRQRYPFLTPPAVPRLIKPPSSCLLDQTCDADGAASQGASGTEAGETRSLEG
jgi:hypothetical protein